MENTNELKNAARGYADYYSEVRRHLSTEFSAEVRWFSASLFALNAGGLVALGASEESLTDGLWQSGLAFWIGIALAMGVVWYSQVRTKSFLHVIQKMEEQYVLTSISGRLDQEKMQQLESQKAAVSTRLAYPLQIMSFLAFTAGLYLFGWPID